MKDDRMLRAGALAAAALGMAGALMSFAGIFMGIPEATRAGIGMLAAAAATGGITLLITGDRATVGEFLWNPMVMPIISRIALRRPGRAGESTTRRTRMTQDQLPPFNPEESVFPELIAQEALNEALAHLMDEASEDLPQGEYPGDDELDRIAPSLKGLVTREIREQKLDPCRHVFSQVTDLAHDVVQALPDHERQALLETMRNRNPGQ